LTSFSKPNQANPNKKAWISLYSFGRIEAFQRVTANPNKKFLSLASPSADALNGAALCPPIEHHSVDAAFQKANVQKFPRPPDQSVGRQPGWPLTPLIPDRAAVRHPSGTPALS
jgi:hypothetical protein